MKLKRILPIIVAVSVLLCALVPFAVSADPLYDIPDRYAMPTQESKYLEQWGGYERFIFKQNTAPFCSFTPKIGSSIVVDEVEYTVKHIGFKTIKESNGINTLRMVAICEKPDGGYIVQKFGSYIMYCPGGTPAITVVMSSVAILDNWFFASCPIYKVNADDTFELIRGPLAFPKPSPLDSVKNVDMSPALVEVLGVLPACLACLVAYASIRKGIGYVHSIFSNA